MSASYGIDLLDEGNWTPERLGEALARDLSRLTGSQDHPEPGLEQSLTRVLAIVSQHAIGLLLNGRFDALGDLARQISSLFSQFPALPMLRELPLRDRAGAHLDGLLGLIQGAEHMPSRSRVEALLQGGRGAESRYDAVRCLAEEAGGLSTQELMQKMGIEFRQTVHLILRKLREQGVVVSEPAGPTHYHRLTPFGRSLWENRRERVTQGHEMKVGTDENGVSGYRIPNKPRRQEPAAVGHSIKPLNRRELDAGRPVRTHGDEDLGGVRVSRDDEELGRVRT